MEKLVLLAFLDGDRRAAGGNLFPSLGRIAWQTGVGYATVRRAVKALRRRRVLEAVGYVSSAAEPRGRVTKYRFHEAHLPTRPARDRSSERAPVPDRQELNDDATGAQIRRDRSSQRALYVRTERTAERTTGPVRPFFVLPRSRSKQTGAVAPRVDPEKKGEKTVEKKPEPPPTTTPDGSDDLAVAREIVTALTAATRERDWFDECQARHGGTCGGSWKHRNQMLIDEARAQRTGTPPAGKKP
jgi:hypothetical protein